MPFQRVGPGLHLGESKPVLDYSQFSLRIRWERMNNKQRCARHVVNRTSDPRVFRVTLRGMTWPA